MLLCACVTALLGFVFRSPNVNAQARSGENADDRVLKLHLLGLEAGEMGAVLEMRKLRCAQAFLAPQGK